MELKTSFVKVNQDGSVKAIKTVRTYADGRKYYELEDGSWYEDCDLTFNQPTPKRRLAITLADLEDALASALEAGYINEYGAHRIKDLIKPKLQFN